jgi:hypothetical protein
MRLQQTFAVIALSSLIACAPNVDTGTPSLESITLRANSTRDTANLMLPAGRAYALQNPAVSLLTEVESQATWETTSPQRQGIFVTHHYPPTSDVWALPVARDGLVILMHESNPLSDLSIQDIRRIYQGTTNQWSFPNGQDVPIQPIMRPIDSALHNEFNRLVMGQRRITPNAIIANSNTQVMELVRQEQGAIAYVSYSFLQQTITTDDISVIISQIEGTPPNDNNIRQNTYALPMTIFALSVNPPSEAYQNFAVWLQQYVAASNANTGYLPAQ